MALPSFDLWRYWIPRRILKAQKKIACLSIASLVAFYFSVPVVVMMSERIRRHIVFMNEVNLQYFVNYSAPEREGLLGSQNLYVTTDQNVKLGVWLISAISSVGVLPYVDDPLREKWFLEKLGDGKPVVLYCHGNNPSRATTHRTLMYDVLRALDFHVIAFDYRGFADSSHIDPSEEGVVSDTRFMIKWARSHAKGPFFVFGHSLGTGIATETVAQLCIVNGCPDALVLQSPFTSIRDELHTSRVTKPYRLLPWFDYMFVRPFEEMKLTFNTKHHILSVQCPILILHAEDDTTVPFQLGAKLYQIALNKRPTTYGPVIFRSFDAKFGYGHNYICKAPELPAILRSFFNDASKRIAG